MKTKLIKQLLILAIPVSAGIWLYYHPLPIWLENIILATIVSIGIYQNLKKWKEN